VFVGNRTFSFIGVEAYGLVGVHTTLQAMFSLLDLGLGGAMMREIASLSVEPDAGPKMRRLVRTLEGVYWVIGIVVGIITNQTFVERKRRLLPNELRVTDDEFVCGGRGIVVLPFRLSAWRIVQFLHDAVRRHDVRADAYERA